MTKILRAFFYSGSKFMPTYFYIFTMMLFVFAFLATKLTIVTVKIVDAIHKGGVKELDPNLISDLLLTTLFGGVVGWVFAHNYDRKNMGEPKEVQPVAKSGIPIPNDPPATDGPPPEDHESLTPDEKGG